LIGSSLAKVAIIAGDSVRGFVDRNRPLAIDILSLYLAGLNATPQMVEQQVTSQA
jgi:hypothetical protein